MLYVNTRDQQRTLSNKINERSGCKRVVPERKKDSSLGWGVRFKSGTLSLPEGVTVKPRKGYFTVTNGQLN